MKRLKLSPEAARDVRDIWSYIAEDSIKAARKVRLSLFDACRLLAENPNIGHSRGDFTDQPVLCRPARTQSSTIPEPSPFPLSEFFMVLATFQACFDLRVLPSPSTTN